MSEGGVRHGSVAGDLGPDDARALLRGVHRLDRTRAQRPRADRAHAVRRSSATPSSSAGAPRPRAQAARRPCENTRRALLGRGRPADLGAAAVDTGRELFAAAIPAIPYAPAAAFLGKEKAKLTPGDGPKRVALVADAIGGVHGVTHTIERIRDLGVPGHEVEVVGTDRNVDRRLPAAAEVEVPFYAGLEIGVPSLPAWSRCWPRAASTSSTSTAPGPGRGDRDRWSRGSWSCRCWAAGTPSSAPTPALRSSSRELERGMDAAPGDLLPPVRAGAVAEPGQRRLARQPRRRAGPHRPLGPRGRHLALRSPATRRATRAPPRPAARSRSSTSGGRRRRRGSSCWPTRSFAPTRRDPRLHLLLGGGGPEEGYLRERLGDRATFLGWLDGDELPRAYASADIFLFTSRTDTFGQVLVEAGASGLPGRRRRRGRPGLDRRSTARPDASAIRTRPCSRRRSASSPMPRRGEPSSAARAWRRRGRAPGRPRWPSSPMATLRCWSPSPRRGTLELAQVA